MIRLVLMATLIMQSNATGLHSALTPDEAALTKTWKAGYERAKTDKTLYRAHKFAKRGVGRINNVDVSWVLWQHPRLLAFEQGFAARKDEWTSEQQAASLRGLSSLVKEGGETLRFHCELGIYPKLGSGIQRVADIRNLEGVSAVLQVGDKTYTPRQQPEEVAPTVNKGVHKWSEQVAVRTREVKGSDGKTRTETDYVTVNHQVEYTYYTGNFDVVFALKNEDGTPRIKEGDTEFTVMVKGAFGNQKATYNLKEWLTAYEK